MSFDKDTKESIKRYMLELMWKQNQKKDIIKKAVNTYNISTTTVNRYIKDLIKNDVAKENIIDNIIKYRLVSKKIVKSYYPKKEKLEEDIIYTNDFNKYFQEYANNIKHIWTYCFTEMMNNAIEHSDSNEITCFFIQNYLKTIIVIEDNGVGIFNKIKAYNKEILKKDISIEEACSQLFAGKLTTDVSRHSGEGIFFTSRIVDHFVILSSNTIFTHNAYTENIIEDDEISKIIKIGKKGTAVFMFLNNFSPKNMEEVFSMYSDFEKGFFKTQIPIKMMIENGYPVSRSQARRLYNTFDKFDEIILDFKDIDNIGQAFTHEMFIVFSRNNPNKKIIVDHANDKISDMINRVKNTII